ncbi:MAG: hypothetical protein ACRC6V_18315 [Bacteroidales bacterium]
MKRVVVAHREYTKEGQFHRVFSLPHNRIADAIADANLILYCYTETVDLQAVNPCNITVRGPNGRFMKWKDK